MLLMLSPAVAFSYPTASSLMRPKVSKLPPLHYSAFMGGLKEIERLLAAGEAKIDDLDEDGNTVLHWSAFGSTTLIPERLITVYKARFNIRNNEGRTFLANAAALHREDMLKLALEHDTNINVRNAYGKTPLLEAVTATIEGGEKERAAPLEVITELLFAAGADPYIADDYGELPLRVVAEYRSAAVLGQFLDAGADPVREHGDKRRNALHLAARWADDLEKLPLLLAHADLNPKEVDLDGYNAADLAVLHALNYRANQSYVDYAGDGSGAEKARARDKKKKLRILEGVALLFERGVSPNTGDTLVRALFQDAETAQLLMANGVDLRQPSTRGVTPLMAASAAGNVTAVETILAHDVDVEAVDNEGKTALGYAAGGVLRTGVPALKPLLKHGVNVYNAHGRIALRAAVKNDDKEIAQLLLESITAGDPASNPVPYGWLVGKSDADVFADHGTDVWLYRKEHVLDFAHSEEMLELLRSYGITPTSG